MRRWVGVVSKSLEWQVWGLEKAGLSHPAGQLGSAGVPGSSSWPTKHKSIPILATAREGKLMAHLYGNQPLLPMQGQLDAGAHIRLQLCASAWRGGEMGQQGSAPLRGRSYVGTSPFSILRRGSEWMSVGPWDIPGLPLLGPWVVAK